MKPAAERLAADLNQVDLQAPAIPVLQNVDVSAQSDVEQIKTRLEQQLYAPVRWTQTMETLQNMNVDTVAECGPGKVLSGLFKRFDRSLNVVPLLNTKGMDKLLGS